jgi:hypothetical protein
MREWIVFISSSISTIESDLMFKAAGIKKTFYRKILWHSEVSPAIHKNLIPFIKTIIQEGPKPSSTREVLSNKSPV